MRFPKVAACLLFGSVLLSASTGWTQQKFPLRQGEWTMTTPDPTNPSQPLTLNICMNDQAWSRAVTPNSICAVSNLNITASGLTYSFTCKGSTLQMSGTGNWKFDGMEHIAATAVTNYTIGGKPTTQATKGDYRWKQTACNPNDVNLRAVSR